MADITVTVASVEPVYGAASPPEFDDRISNATVTAGQPLYENTAARDWRGRPKLDKCDANASTTAALCYGISLHAALAGQPIRVIKGGYLYLGAIGGSVLTAGEMYAVSATAGGICPVADVTTGTDLYPCLLGVADTTAILHLSSPFIVGIAVNA